MNSIMAFSPDYASEDNSTPLLQTCISFLILETIFIVLFHISRYLSRDQKGMFWMPLLITGGFFVCVAKITIGILMVRIGGAGHHLATLQPHTIVNSMKLNTTLQIICPFTTSLTKLGVLCLYHEVLSQASRTCRVLVNATFLAILIILIVQVVIPFANCRPFNYNWNFSVHGSCTANTLDLWRYLAIPNVVTTIVMVCIPMPALYGLKVSLPIKAGFCSVVLVCLLGLIASIMRLQAFLSVSDLHDISFQAVKPLCWTIAESGMYLVAGILLTLKPLLKRVLGFERLDKLRSWRLGGTPMSGSAGVRDIDLGKSDESRMSRTEKGKPPSALIEKCGAEMEEFDTYGSRGQRRTNLLHRER